MGGSPVNPKPLLGLLWNPRWTSRRKFFTASGMALILAAAGYGGDLLANHIAADQGSCMHSGATTVMREGSECVGVTDGSFQFPFADTQLSTLESRLATEDSTIRGRGDYVSIVYLLPSPSGSQDTDATEPLALFTNQLAGALAAITAYNTEVASKQAQPYVQLLLAADGDAADQYGPVDDIIASDVNSQHVVAVAGLAVSETDTLAAAKDLTSKKSIPVVGGPTAGEFDDVKDFVRVTPSNAQDVSSLLSDPMLASATTRYVLVSDTNGGDLYSLDLSSAFKAQAPPSGVVADPTYSSAPGAYTPDTFKILAAEICDARPAGDPVTVLFSGRSAQLNLLLDNLDGNCPATTHVTILTGGNVINIGKIDSSASEALRQNVSVYFPGQFTPAEWSPQDLAAPFTMGGTSYKLRAALSGYQKYQSAIQGLNLRNVPTDTNTALAYDSVLVCTTAITHTYSPGGKPPQPGMVAAALSLFQPTSTLTGLIGPIFGAAGPIALSGNYTDPKGSDPIGALTPILRLEPDGSFGFVRLDQVPVP
jgi:hypothetical protein